MSCLPHKVQIPKSGDFQKLGLQLLPVFTLCKDKQHQHNLAGAEAQTVLASVVSQRLSSSFFLPAHNGSRVIALDGFLLEHDCAMGN